MKTLSNINLKGKVVLLRTDLNSDIKNKKLLKSEKIKQANITIKKLKSMNAKIVVISHQGKQGKDYFPDLKQHAKQLNKYVEIKFVDDIIGKKAERAISNLKSGEAILLDNIRKQPDEFKPDKNNKIIKFFKNKIDIYVNDAFSVCHRKHTSMLIPRYVKIKSYAGLLLEKEINGLKKIKLKNCLYILGGAKPKDNVKLLGKNKILSCGLFGQVCFINKGKRLGEQEKYLKKGKYFIRISKNKLKKVQTPIDFAVKIKGRRKEINVDDFPSKYEIFDIGEDTIKIYAGEIKKAKAIYMKGPAGDVAIKGFEKGTYSILRAIASSKAYSLIGGGHLSDAIEKSKINKKKFNHISLSGGALLNYIAGEKLPGLEALKS
tara:strand:- start:9175 stop:10302 length:1128 start_codon:yes stop_codon:yes gene_type:complete